VAFPLLYIRPDRPCLSARPTLCPLPILYIERVSALIKVSLLKRYLSYFSMMIGLCEGHLCDSFKTVNKLANSCCNVLTTL